MTRVRLGSVILLVLGLVEIIASVTYVPGPTPELPLLMLGTGVVFVVVAILTIQIKN